MKLEQVFFEATDGLELSGLLFLPETKTEKIVIAVHGMASNCMKKRDAIIAKKLTQSQVAYLSFNNRGHDLISYSRKPIQQKKKTVFIGTTNEDMIEAYEDIKSAIQMVLELGYTNIYLQGHSLGCTKIIYTYNELLKRNEQGILSHIKAVVLLSLIDIQGMQQFLLKDKYQELLAYAIEKEQQGKQTELMPNNAFIWPISVKTYLRYFRDNEEINVAPYQDKQSSYPKLNAITVPIMMRWGTQGDLIAQDPFTLVKQMQEKLTQTKKDISVIEGAGHNYREKEEELATQIEKFICYI